MRDKNRIPQVLKEMERIWLAHPDYRLGQLMVIASRPKTPCPAVFYIEDDKLLEGLRAFETRTPMVSEAADELPDWKKYPDISRGSEASLTLDLLVEMMVVLRVEQNKKMEQSKIVITPARLMKLNGAPVSDRTWLRTQALRMDKIAQLLAQLEERGILKKRTSKPLVPGIEEVAYELTDSKKIE